MTAEKSNPSAHDFVLTRVFNAPRELVFAAWTTAAHLSQWFGPRCFDESICQSDPRPGGDYRIVMRSPDGIDYPMKGNYLEFVPPELLVFTQDLSEHPPEWFAMLKQLLGSDKNLPLGLIHNRVTFEDQNGKTKLTLTVHFDAIPVRNAMIEMGMSEGWPECLDRLEELLTKI